MYFPMMFVTDDWGRMWMWTCDNLSPGHWRRIR